MTLKQLIEKLLEIKKTGFIKTHRSDDTGIGKTLEDMLRIKENNFSLPDIGEIELKAKRLDSDSMLTIATKSPEPKGANRILFEKYKYKDENGIFNLHSTVIGSKTNPQGFKITFKGKNIFLENKLNIKIFWPITIFNSVLKAKSNIILLVFANTKGERKTRKEKFHFVEGYLLSNLNNRKFKSAIEHDKLKIDIRIGCYRSGKFKGKYHDHGTGFRIAKRDFLHLFDKYEKLI